MIFLLQFLCIRHFNFIYQQLIKNPSQYIKENQILIYKLEINIIK